MFDQQHIARHAGMRLADHVVAAVDQHRVEQAACNGAAVDKNRF